MKNLFILLTLGVCSFSSFADQSSDNSKSNFYFGIEHIQVLGDIEGAENENPSSNGISFGGEKYLDKYDNVFVGGDAGYYHTKNADSSSATNIKIEGYLGLDVFKYCNIGAFLSVTTLNDMYNGEEYHVRYEDETNGLGVMYGPRVGCSIKRNGKKTFEFIIKAAQTSDDSGQFEDATVIQGQFKAYLN